MKNDNRKQSISSVAALLVFALFAVGIVSVLISGAGAYRRLTKRDSLAYDSRTCMQYVATRVRQASEPGAVDLSEFGDGNALVIRQDLDGESYVTRVYSYDGWLMELFSPENGEFVPENGEKILQVNSLSLEREDNLFTIEIEDGNGRKEQLKLSVRGGEEADL